MTMTSTGLKLTFATAALIAATGTAFADTDFGKVSAYVALQSDYRYRGISQNAKDITPEASLNWSAPMGFYAGTWVAKTNWGGGNPSFEMDLYAGKHTDIYGTDLNIEAYYYSYPDANFGGTKASYYETIAQLSRSFGKLTLTATGAHSPEWSLSAGTGWYGAGTAAYALTDWLSLSGTLGHQWVKNAPSDYTHWDLGATATWKSWTLDVRYVDNDIKSGDCSNFWMGTTNACKGTAQVTLTYNIADIFQ
jgi:uncharacterized protein (TIGR02001 family)